MKIKVFNSQTNVEVTELDFAEILAERAVCLVGRSTNSDLILDSPQISRLHGKFFCQNGEIYYTDLGSKNGSKVNDENIATNQSYLLKPEDVIKAGEFVFVVQETNNVSEDATFVKPLNVNDEQEIEIPDEAVEEVIETRVIVEPPGALVKVITSTIEADDPKSQTKALLVAINKRVLGELQAAGTLTRDAYIKAVRKARETIEHNKLIAPEELEKEAKKYWKSLVRGTSSLSSRLGSAAAKRTSELGSRLSSAAKAALGAAWKEITAPKSNSESEPKQSRSQVVSHAPETVISEENHQQTFEAILSQPASENKLHLTHSEDELSHLSSENQVKEDELPED